jgi:hypothetical protein
MHISLRTLVPRSVRKAFPEFFEDLVDPSLLRVRSSETTSLSFFRTVLRPHDAKDLSWLDWFNAVVITREETPIRFERATKTESEPAVEARAYDFTLTEYELVYGFQISTLLMHYLQSIQVILACDEKEFLITECGHDKIDPTTGYVSSCNQYEEPFPAMCLRGDESLVLRIWMHPRHMSDMRGRLIQNDCVVVHGVVPRNNSLSKYNSENDHDDHDNVEQLLRLRWVHSEGVTLLFDEHGCNVILKEQRDHRKRAGAFSITKS